MGPVAVNKKWCKGCGICVAFCPKKTLELDREDKAFQIRPEDCIRCGMCMLYCPDLALELLPVSEGAPNCVYEETRA